MEPRYISLVCLWLILSPAGLAQHEHPAGPPEQLGKVQFTVSCAPSVQVAFNRAVAMLHSFWYERAAEEFTRIARQDPSCAMAYWGVAMTHYHPLWEPPGAPDLKAGGAAVEQAKALGAKTDRERAYIAAIETFFRDAHLLDHPRRALAYEQAMEQLAARFADDREASVFHALALLGSAAARPPDKTYARQIRAGTIAEKVFAEQPDHPGVAHYIIHSYDYPPLAERALAAARRYAKIAPDSPHALHMPSHIFTRLGLWEESIQSNLDSAASAHRHGSTGDELHAMDYLMYAYLQTAQDRAAEQLLASPPRMKGVSSAYFAGLYATALMPARFYLERLRWAEAAELSVPADLFPGRYVSAAAHLHFAKGLGAARSGKPEVARAEVGRLAALHQTLLENKETYWAGQADILRQVLAAWLARAEGRNDEALRQMRAAAAAEDATDKHPVTPGPIRPARELLGDLLLELGRPAEALAEFEAVLGSAPRRFNALYGAARAAQFAGEREKAARHYSQLVALCPKAQGDRPQLVEARTFLAAAQAGAQE